MGHRCTLGRCIHPNSVSLSKSNHREKNLPKRHAASSPGGGFARWRPPMQRLIILGPWSLQQPPSQWRQVCMFEAAPCPRSGIPALGAFGHFPPAAPRISENCCNTPGSLEAERHTGSAVPERHVRGSRAVQASAETRCHRSQRVDCYSSLPTPVQADKGPSCCRRFWGGLGPTLRGVACPWPCLC